jgi:hypothetical protein
MYSVSEEVNPRELGGTKLRTLIRLKRIRKAGLAKKQFLHLLINKGGSCFFILIMK